MSSNRERVPKAGTQAGAEEAAVDFLLVEIGKRSPSPTKAVKVCQILDLGSRENIKKVREIAKNKDVSEPENKKREEEMEVRLGYGHYVKIATAKGQRFADKTENMLNKLIQEKGLNLTAKRDGAGWRPFIDVGPLMANGALDYGRGFQVCPAISGNPEIACMDLKRNWACLTVRVDNKDCLNLAKKFARTYEKRSKKSVTLEKEY